MVKNYSWDASVNEPVLRLIGMLVLFLFPIRGQNLSRCFRDLLVRRSLLPNSTVLLDTVYQTEDQFSTTHPKLMSSWKRLRGSSGYS